MSRSTSRKTTRAKTKAKGLMRDALSASMSAEANAFQARLEKAEKALQSAQALDPAQVLDPEQALDPEKVSNPEKVSAAPEKPEIEETPARRIPRVVRDAFTMPEGDYALIEQARQRCLNNAVTITKAEALRAGLQALAKMSDKELLAAVESLEKVPVGRPKISRRPG